jgi:hypothetical protein
MELSSDTDKQDVKTQLGTVEKVCGLTSHITNNLWHRICRESSRKTKVLQGRFLGASEVLGNLNALWPRIVQTCITPRIPQLR